MVDNASTDGTVEKIKKSYPAINLIANEKNLGFPQACNQGLKQAHGDYLLLLNPDTELSFDTLNKCLSVMEKEPQIGLLGVKIKLPNGRVQLHGGRSFPNLFSLLCNSLGLDRAFASLRIFPSPDLPHWDHASNREVDMISGTFMLFRRQLYAEIGGLDETLPMFLEDMEFCWRAKKAGWRIYYYAETEIVHHTGKSSARSPSCWITSLRYEANHLMLHKMGKTFESRAYPPFIFFLTPVRLFLLPFWLFSLKKRDLEANSLTYCQEVLQSGLWSARKIRLMIFDFSLRKNKNRCSIKEAKSKI